MWIRRGAAVFFLLIALFVLNACTIEESTIIYNGTEMPISEAEERISNALEAENPYLDIEVSIYEETDD